MAIQTFNHTTAENYINTSNKESFFKNYEGIKYDQAWSRAHTLP